ncbi:MAG: hypothetical protein WCH11_01275 [Bdellovibrio sp.]
MCAALLRFGCDRSRAQEQPTEATENSSGSSVSSKASAGLDLFFAAADRGEKQPNWPPALDAQFGYSWEKKARLGFFSSSRKFGLDDDYLKFSLVAAYRIQLLQSLALEMQFDLHQMNLSRWGGWLDLDLWTYHLFWDQRNKWLGKDGIRSEVGLRKSWNAFWGFDWPLEISSIQNPGITSQAYFSIRTGLNYKFAEPVQLALLFRYVSDSSINFNVDGYPLAYFLFTSRF